MKAVIAGAGIAGLTAALCLKRVGWEVEVLEQADTITPVGAGLQISPNGCHVLRELGLLAPLEKMAFAPECIEMRLGKSGRQVFSIPLQATAMQRWEAPYLHIHRADLLSILVGALEAASPGALKTGHALRSYRISEQGITVGCQNGYRSEGDLLIGADGIHSTVQALMPGESAPRFTGNVAWRATVPMNRLDKHPPPPTACIWTGSGRHAVSYRLRGGELANFVGVVEQDQWDSESWTARGSREKVLADFEDWHPVITSLIEQADTHFQWALFDREPLEYWSNQRVVLIGDACHPMLPFLAQGAVMAIEDAWVLAAMLNTRPDIASALNHYEQERKTRTTRVQAASRANMKRFHFRSPAAYLPLWLAGKILPGMFLARQDWLYGFNVTSDT